MGLASRSILFILGTASLAGYAVRVSIASALTQLFYDCNEDDASSCDKIASELNDVTPEVVKISLFAGLIGTGACFLVLAHVRTDSVYTIHAAIVVTAAAAALDALSACFAVKQYVIEYSDDGTNHLDEKSYAYSLGILDGIQTIVSVLVLLPALLLSSPSNTSSKAANAPVTRLWLVFCMIGLTAVAGVRTLFNALFYQAGYNCIEAGTSINDSILCDFATKFNVVSYDFNRASLVAATLVFAQVVYLGVLVKRWDRLSKTISIGVSLMSLAINTIAAGFALKQNIISYDNALNRDTEDNGIESDSEFTMIAGYLAYATVIVILITLVSLVLPSTPAIPLGIQGLRLSFLVLLFAVVVFASSGVLMALAASMANIIYDCAARSPGDFLTLSLNKYCTDILPELSSSGATIDLIFTALFTGSAGLAAAIAMFVHSLYHSTSTRASANALLIFTTFFGVLSGGYAAKHFDSLGDDDDRPIALGAIAFLVPVVSLLSIFAVSLQRLE